MYFCKAGSCQVEMGGKGRGERVVLPLAIRSLPHANFTGPECREEGELYMDAGWVIQHCLRRPYIPSANALFALVVAGSGIQMAWVEAERRSTSILAWGVGVVSRLWKSQAAVERSTSPAQRALQGMLLQGSASARWASCRGSSGLVVH
jgi:hypothetical protein